MKQKITKSENEFKDFYTIEWEQSVKIIRWEHDFENKKYVIEYEEEEIKERTMEEINEIIKETINKI